MTRTPRLIVSLGALLVMGAGLSACGGGASLGLEQPLTPTSRYSLQVEPGIDRIALAVHEAGLSSTQGQALGALLDRFAASGAETLLIEAPSGGDPIAASMAWTVRAGLEAAGLNTDRIRVVSYHAPDPRAPVLAGFETVNAVVPRCGQAWGNLTRTADNGVSSNFGCAVNANLAAQISNPRDIQSPRAMTSASASRRAVVYDNYTKGTATAAAAENLVTGARISEAVQ